MTMTRLMPVAKVNRWCRISSDGVWQYVQRDDAGTTWSVTHLPTGRTLDYEPSLAIARRGTADGWTLAELDRREIQAQT